MNFFNVLNKEKINTKEIVSLKEKSFDYITSIPHSGTLIPLKFINRFNISRAMLIGSDLHTSQVYNTPKGIELIFNLSAYFVNPSRPREKNNNPNLPPSLRRDPLHGESLTPEKILKKDYTSKETENILKYYDLYHKLLSQSIKKNEKNSWTCFNF